MQNKKYFVNTKQRGPRLNSERGSVPPIPGFAKKTVANGKTVEFEASSDIDSRSLLEFSDGRPVVAPKPLLTGCSVLDDALAQAGIGAGGVIHLCGALSLYFGLNMCGAACEGEERSVLLDTNGALDFINQPLYRDPQCTILNRDNGQARLHRFGLAPYCDPDELDSAKATFSIKRLSNANEFEAQMEQIREGAQPIQMGEPTPSPMPSVIVLSSLESLFEGKDSSGRPRKLDARQTAEAHRRVERWLREWPAICQAAGTTLVLCHSPHHPVRFGMPCEADGKYPAVLPFPGNQVGLSRFEKGIWSRMFGFANPGESESVASRLPGLETGAFGAGPPCATVPVRLWRGNTQLGCDLLLPMRDISRFGNREELRFERLQQQLRFEKLHQLLCRLEKKNAAATH